MGLKYGQKRGPYATGRFATAVAVLGCTADIIERRAAVALVLAVMLLWASFPGTVGAADRASDHEKRGHRWITEVGWFAGYGSGAHIYEGHYDTLLLVAHIGSNVNRFIPALERHRGALSLFLEPQFNPVLRRSEYEFGLGIGVQYTYALTEWLSPYLLLATGPHYISIDTETQAKGFNFSNAAGIGFYIPLNKNAAVNCGYRLRHVSNADLKEPNGGIDNHVGLLGVSFFFSDRIRTGSASSIDVR